MSSISLIAQTLPGDIVNGIASYILPLPYRYDKKANNLSQELNIPGELVTMMQVCRSWKYGLDMRFYRRAIVPVNAHSSIETWALPLAKDIDEKNRVLVKEVVVVLGMSVLLTKENGIQRINGALAGCGQLISATHVVVKMFSDGDLSQFSDSKVARTSDYHSYISEINLRLLAKHILEIAPNMHGIAWINSEYSRAIHNPGSCLLVHKAALQSIHIAYPQIKQIFLHGISSSPLATRIDILGKLRSLVLIETELSDVDAELAAANCDTLEYLRIAIYHHRNTLLLFRKDPLSGKRRIYKQLHRLVIDSHRHGISDNREQLNYNPFPALRLLICKGKLPFILPQMFYDGFGNINHLDIELTPEDLELLQSRRVLEKGMFQKLYFLRLGWDSNMRRMYLPRHAEAITKAATELSRSTRVLHLHNYFSIDVGGVLPSVEFPHYLQQLYMPSILLDIDNLVALLDRLKYLEIATVGLQCSLECSEAYGPSSKDIREYQKRLKSNSASVNSLSINAYGYRVFQKAAENVVLLADILPQITCMKIFSTSRHLTDELDIINQARSRPVYRSNIRLQGVKFSLASAWELSL